MTPLELRQAIERVLGDSSSELGDVIGTYSNGDRAIQNGQRIKQEAVSGGIEVVIYPYLYGNPSKAQHYKVSLINHRAEPTGESDTDPILMDEILQAMLTTTDSYITVDGMGPRVIPPTGMNSERIDLRIINGLAGRAIA